jgi:hypothetical protein
MSTAAGIYEAEQGPSRRVDGIEHERRFVLTRAQAVRFMAAVGPHVTLELHDRTRPIAYTRTTYFDTEDLTYFRSCQGPVARRLRLREYALAPDLGQTPTLTGACYLELKQNEGDARSKLRVAAPPELIARLVERRGGRENENAGDDAGQRLALDARRRAEDLVLDQLVEHTVALQAIERELGQHRVEPRIATWYRRVSLGGNDGGVRITMDDGLTFSRPRPPGHAGEPAMPGPEVIAYGPPRVLEIKFLGDPPDWLVAAVEDLTPLAHFSKFRMGMTALRQHDDLGGGLDGLDLGPPSSPFLLDLQAHEDAARGTGGGGGGGNREGQR